MLRVKSKKTKGFLSRLIFSILQNNVESRDNWLLTVKEVHDREMALCGFSKDNYYDYVFNYQLTNPQTICRIWRMIQEKNVDLRGSEWADRQRISGEIRNTISSNDSIQFGLFN